MSDGGLRLDRWLWFTRFYKTRTAASAARRLAGSCRVRGRCQAGTVRPDPGGRYRPDRPDPFSLGFAKNANGMAMGPSSSPITTQNWRLAERDFAIR